MWPAAPRVVVAVCLLLLTVAGFWWFDWRGQVETLEARQTEEVQLRESWVTKKRRAVNLEEHRRQLAEIDRQFGALLKQLPNRAEMDSAAFRTSTRPASGVACSSSSSPGADVIRSSTPRCRSTCA